MPTGIYQRKDNRRIVKCDYCKKNIKKYKSIIHNTNFCSRKCQDKYLKIHLNNGCFKKGVLHRNWKGEEIKYAGLHKWINRNYKKTTLCEKCQKKKRLDLANITGVYNRDLKNWRWLCRKCHIEFDKKPNIQVVTDEITSIKKVRCNEKFYDIETETKNFIANGIITHNSKKSKKSVACRTYLPSYVKEMIEVFISIDLSGSIAQKEITDFLSEIVGMSRQFQGAISMRLLTHDTEVQSDYEIKNGNVEKIKKLKIAGGGGTEFNCVTNYINEKYKNKCKCLIWLTDGFGTEIEEKTKYPIIWVLAKSGSDEVIKNRDNRDKIIWLKE